MADPRRHRTELSWLCFLLGLVLAVGAAGGQEMGDGLALEDQPEAATLDTRMGDDSSALQGARQANVVDDHQAMAIWIAANKAHDEGRFAEAVAAYRRLLESGFDDGRIAYNLGNALLHNGELGRAIAAYLQAHRVRPRDRDLRFNLDFARRSARDALDPPEPPAIARKLLFWVYTFSPGELAIAFLCANLLFWSLAVLRLLLGPSEVLRWLLSLAGLLVLVLLISSTWRLAKAPRVAVVVAPETSAHLSPDAASAVRFELHAGAEMAVAEERQEWLRVRLPSGEQGWLETTAVEVVEF